MEERPSVLHLFKVAVPDVYGGIPVTMDLLARGLSDRFSTSVLTARARGPGVLESRDGVPVRRCATLFTVRSLPLAPAYPLRCWLEARRADLVHAHFPFPLTDLALAVGLPRRCRLLVQLHSDIVSQRLLKLPLLPAVRRFLARADAIVVSSRRYLEHVRLLAPHRDRCRVIPLGVEPEAWGRLDEQDEARVSALRERHPRLLAAVGRLVPYKGFSVLLDALHEVDAELWLVGEGPAERSLRARVGALGLAGRVHLPGRLPRPELKRLLHAARALVLPSVAENETFGVVQLEAMACGTPVVNTRLPTGVPWVARHGREGLTVPPGDPDALARALRQLLDDPAEARRLGAGARRRVEERFSAGLLLERYARLYEELLAR